LVYGPSQAYALINQDPTVAQQFALWDQARSKMLHGKMIMIPVQGIIVYIQPVYLESTVGSNIPLLQRVIASQGQLVAMEPSLEKSFEALNRQALTEGKRPPQRLQTLEPPSVPPEVTPEEPSR
jgi:uncharacterized membrane protein (UPF0182 family)